MTYYYQFTNATTAAVNQIEKQKHLKKFLTHVSDKKNWRIVELPNGYYQAEYKPVNCTSECDASDCDCNWVDVTRRETIESCEKSIDSSIEHYRRKLRAFDGPRVVKTFEDEKDE
ncbi:MAG: hypothetical protein DWQ49_12430 [Bacteroidetes bacterium]|nr:MAG: hypothetical protein DWQ49_12430 [Bacteroidota bacterium]